MKNILMLTFANIRKRKSQSIGLLIFVLIAAMFLNIGLVISLGVGGFFDQRSEELNAPHFTAVYESGAVGIDEGRIFAESYPGVTEIEITASLGGWGEYFTNEMSDLGFLIISRADENQKMNPLSLIGEHQPLTGDAIYIPYFMFLADNFQLGDEFKLLLSGDELHFKVAGATEEIFFGAQMNTYFRFYIPSERYNELEKQYPGVTLLNVRLEDINDAVLFTADYDNEISPEGQVITAPYDIMKFSRTMIPLIAAVIVTAFALILLTVSLIVIRFRIINSIEESMTNIGTQKAVGYRSVQIVLSIVTQFALIALIGGILGITAAQFAIPIIIETLLEPMLALIWKPGFDILVAVISLTAVLLAVTLISYLAARRINRLHPLIALRGGIETHNFKKNPLPLDRSRGSLNLLLSLKQILRNKKQSVTIVVIIALVTMASVATIAVNYNMNEGRENFLGFFGEMPEAMFMLSDEDAGEGFIERLRSRPEVNKAFAYQTSGAPLLIDEVRAEFTIVEDTSLMESNMLISGRYPIHSNEIAVGAMISRATGKSVRDTVTVRRGDSEKEYLVTGIIQNMSYSGFNGIITGDALREIQPEFMFTEYAVYMHGGFDTNEFIDSVKAAEGEIIGATLNIRDQMNSIFETIGAIFSAVAIGVAAVTAFIVILVLYMIIKTTILRRRRELGIQKAVGFTTFQLMNQIALNMTPIILIGVIIGAVTGYFGFSPMMAAMMSGFGIVQVDLPAPVDQIIIVCIALVILAYAVSMLIARRIRKISAYALVSE